MGIIIYSIITLIYSILFSNSEMSRDVGRTEVSTCPFHHVVVHVAKRKPVLVFNKLCGTIKIDRSSTFIDSDFYLMDNKAK